MNSQYNEEFVADVARQVKEPLDRQKNEQLYARVVRGDLQARDEMIEGNLPLVFAKVEAYIGCYPHLAYLRDDLQSAGCLGLVKAVNTMMEHKQLPKTSNATGYISISIQQQIGELVDSENPIQVNGRSQRRARANAEPIEVPLTSNHLPESVEARFNSDLVVFELRDLIEACCETEEERTIVRMREQGYVDREIAEALDMPLSTTYMLRRGIQERFLERSAAEDKA